MATIKLPYVQLYKARGRAYAYYRRGQTRMRLAGEIGSPEFIAAYQAAKDSYEETARPVAERKGWPEGSLGALIAAWRASPDYAGLREKTREGYDWGLSSLTDAHKAGPVAKLNRAWIIRTRDTLADTPGKANYFVTTLKLLLFWGMDRGWLAVNPAVKIKRMKTGGGYRAWTDAEIEAFTGPAAGALALPVLLGLYTGQRRGDVLALPWEAYDGHSITLIQSKTGAAVSVPAHPVLKQALDAAADHKSAETICARPDGKAWTESHFAHSFAAARGKLGLSGDVQFHGLRHSSASRMAEAGASDSQIQAVTGHKTRQMVEHYTSGARKKQLAADAIAALPEKQIKGAKR